MAYHINENDEKKIGKILAALRRQSGADECLLCDNAGHVLAEESTGAAANSFEASTIGALGSGVFVAARQLASVIGEDEFSALFHQGKKKSISIRGVTEDVLLFVTFANPANIGLVKFYSEPASAQLAAVFREVAERNHSVDPGDHRAFVLNDDVQIFSPQAVEAGVS